MNQREIDFLRRVVAERPSSRAAGSSATSLAVEQHVGRLERRTVVYTEADYTRAANLLASHGISLVVPAIYSRSEAPAGQSEKSGAKKVTADLVAVRTLNMPDPHSPLEGFLATRWKLAASMDFEVLMVVENLEALLRLDEFRWLDSFVKGRRTLALFRGTVGMFGTAAAGQLIRTDDRPTLAFFDFDPKGLAMADSIPRREALCLPAIPLLLHETKKQARRNLFTQSADVSETQLNRTSDAQIAALWKQMVEMSKGLDQEHFPTAG